MNRRECIEKSINHMPVVAAFDFLHKDLCIPENIMRSISCYLCTKIGCRRLSSVTLKSFLLEKEKYEQNKTKNRGTKNFASISPPFSHRQHQSSQSDFSSHCCVRPGRLISKKTDQSGHDRYSCRWSIFSDGSGREMKMKAVRESLVAEAELQSVRSNPGAGQSGALLHHLKKDSDFVTNICGHSYDFGFFTHC